jgi:hypothetical protein
MSEEAAFQRAMSMAPRLAGLVTSGGEPMVEFGRCPNCGWIVALDAVYCPRCGTAEFFNRESATTISTCNVCKGEKTTLCRRCDGWGRQGFLFLFRCPGCEGGRRRCSACLGQGTRRYEITRTTDLRSGAVDEESRPLPD